MAAPTAASPSPSPQIATRPDGVPESFWDKGSNAVKYGDWGKSYEELRAFKASDDARRAALPAQADLYEAKLPDGFKFPEGMELKTDTPMFKAARDMAHKAGWSQEQFTQALGLYAKDAADRYSEWLNWRKQEDEALGENREARKQARDRFIESSAKAWFPASEADAVIAHLKGTPVSANVFRWMEKAAEAFSRQGMKSYSGAGRDGDTGRADGLPDNWDGLDSVTQRTWLLQNPQWRSEAARRH